MEKTSHPMIRPSALARAKAAAPEGVIAFRPRGSPFFYLYGDDAVAFHLMFGEPGGHPFDLADEVNVYPVSRNAMGRMARRAWQRTRLPVTLHGVDGGCDPRWFT